MTNLCESNINDNFLNNHNLPINISIFYIYSNYNSLNNYKIICLIYYTYVLKSKTKKPKKILFFDNGNHIYEFLGQIDGRQEKHTH